MKAATQVVPTIIVTIILVPVNREILSNRCLIHRSIGCVPSYPTLCRYTTPPPNLPRGSIENKERERERRYLSHVLAYRGITTGKRDRNYTTRFTIFIYHTMKYITRRHFHAVCTSTRAILEASFSNLFILLQLREKQSSRFDREFSSLSPSSFFVPSQTGDRRRTTSFRFVQSKLFDQLPRWQSKSRRERERKCVGAVKEENLYIRERHHPPSISLGLA